MQANLNLRDSAFFLYPNNAMLSLRILLYFRGPCFIDLPSYPPLAPCHAGVVRQGEVRRWQVGLNANVHTPLDGHKSRLEPIRVL